MRREWGPEDLIVFWTLIEPDWELIGSKPGATRLGFAALLNFSRSTAGSRSTAPRYRNRLWRIWLSRSRSIPRCSRSTSGVGAQVSATGRRSARRWGSASALRPTSRNWRAGCRGRCARRSYVGRRCGTRCSRTADRRRCGWSRRRSGRSPGWWAARCGCSRSGSAARHHHHRHAHIHPCDSGRRAPGLPPASHYRPAKIRSDDCSVSRSPTGTPARSHVSAGQAVP
jgi:hypothetical protein